MLGKAYFSSLYAKFRLLVVAFEKQILAEDYAAETFIFQTLKTTMIMGSG